MKTFKIEEKIFKTETLFLVGGYEEANKYLKKNYGLDEDLNEMAIGTVLKVEHKKTKNFFRIVWVEDAKNIPLVVHEVLHLVVRILNDKGVSIKANIETGECGDETAAYLLEFYMEEFLARTKKRENKNK